MPESINCELFQVRTGCSRVTINRGLAVTNLREEEFVDPQIEPSYHTSYGPADASNLQLQISDADPPEKNDSGIIENLSLNSVLLNGISREGDLRRFRARQPVEKPIGRYALIGVVNHNPPVNRLGYSAVDRDSVRLQTIFRIGYPSRDPVVGLGLVREGGSIDVNHDFGSYFASVEKLRITYEPDAEEGLVITDRQLA